MIQLDKTNNLSTQIRTDRHDKAIESDRSTMCNTWVEQKESALKDVQTLRFHARSDPFSAFWLNPFQTNAAFPSFDSS